MSVTALERIKPEAYEFAPPCEGILNPPVPCSNTATHVIHYICGCIKLACAHCVDVTLAYVADCIGSIMYCNVDHIEVYVAKISDFIVSVDKL